MPTNEMELEKFSQKCLLQGLVIHKKITLNFCVAQSFLVVFDAITLIVFQHLKISYTKYQMCAIFFSLVTTNFWRMRKLDFFTDFRQKKIWLLSSYILLYIYMTYLSQTVSILVWKKACTILYIWYNILFCIAKVLASILTRICQKKNCFQKLQFSQSCKLSSPIQCHFIMTCF